MTRRVLAALSLILLPACLLAVGPNLRERAGVAQETATGKLRVRAGIVDKDLNVKPVPKLVLNLQPAGGGKVVTVTTGFDGTAELDLPAGQYQMTTAQPVEFQGRKYAWEFNVTIQAGNNQLELSTDNAKVSDAAAPPARAMDELSTQFKHLQNAVVTVWSETGSGTGFLIDP